MAWLSQKQSWPALWCNHASGLTKAAFTCAPAGYSAMLKRMRNDRLLRELDRLAAAFARRRVARRLAERRRQELPG